MQLKLTAQLKPTEELKSLEGFIGESVDRLNFKDNINITPIMLNKSSITLTYNKDWKAWSDGEYEYNLDWLTNITVSDDKLKLGLEIDGLKLTVKILEQSSEIKRGGGIYKSHKRKFLIDSLSCLNITSDSIYIHGTGADKLLDSRTFESHKALTKWIRNLIKCK